MNSNKEKTILIINTETEQKMLVSVEEMSDIIIWGQDGHEETVSILTELIYG